MGLTAGRVHVRATEEVQLADVVRALAPGPGQLITGLEPVEGRVGLIVVHAEGSDWSRSARSPKASS
jgi:hypothetical protein